MYAGWYDYSPPFMREFSRQAYDREARYELGVRTPRYVIPDRDRPIDYVHWLLSSQRSEVVYEAVLGMVQDNLRMAQHLHQGPQTELVPLGASRERELAEENRRLKQRVQELEQQLAIPKGTQLKLPL